MVRKYDSKAYPINTSYTFYAYLLRTVHFVYQKIDCTVMENVHSKNGVQHYETLVTQILAINYLYINCGSFSFQSSSPQIMYTCIMYCISLIYSI